MFKCGKKLKKQRVLALVLSLWLSVVMLSVVMLTVVMLNVVVP
jgi:hypothetical protein